MTGILAYSQIGSLKTGATTQFEVSVTDVGRGPQRAQLTDFDGMTVYQQDVPTYGLAGHLFTDGDVAALMNAAGRLEPPLRAATYIP